MKNEEQATRIAVNTQVEHAKDTQNAKYGEKGFTYVLVIIFAFLFYQSILLWQKKPGIDGPAAIPLISSGAILLMTICILISNLKKRVANDISASRMERIKQAVQYVLPVNVAATFGVILLYCMLLTLGVSFYIITSVFLWGLMTFFSRGKCLRHLLWTAICMVFILVVFQLLFKVTMP